MVERLVVGVKKMKKGKGKSKGVKKREGTHVRVEDKKCKIWREIEGQYWINDHFDLKF